MNDATSPGTAALPRPLALVTGASSGIGQALAERLARDGHDLVLTARRVEAMEALAQDWRQRYRIQVSVIGVDLQTPQGPLQLREQTQVAGLHPGVLVNCAGVGVFGPFKDGPLAPDLGLMQLNMNGLVAVTKLFLPDVLARKGHILNVASTAAFQPGPNMALYFASKAFVLHFSEALYAELKADGVTVTTLCPGPTHTGFQGAAQMDKSALFKTPWVSTPAEVADAGYRAMKAGQRVCIPGVMNWLLAKGAAFTPRPVILAIARFMTREG